MKRVSFAIRLLGIKTICLGVLLSAAGNGNAAEFYVDAVNGNDANDGTGWATARQSLQAAVELAAAGDTVWAADGVYNRGKADTPDATRDCRVVLDGVKLYAAENAAPVIDGINDPTDTTGTYDDNDARGVFMLNGAELSGFVIRNGLSATNDTTSGNYLNNAGGGIYMTADCMVSDCLVTNCTATRGGAIYCRGGGTVERCELAGNTATLYGAGLYFYQAGEANNTFAHDNQAASNGGGLYFYQGGTAVNCTSRNNMADSYGNEIDFSGGGTVRNVIAWNPDGAIDRPENAGSITYACAPDGVTHGVNGCITNNPLFAGSDDGLFAGSPCIDAGNMGSGTIDRAGALRNFNAVDLGSREFPGKGILGILAVSMDASLNSTQIQRVSVQLHNSGNVGANWQMVSALPVWLSLSETNGFLNGMSSTSITFSASAEGLPVGTHSVTNRYVADTMDGVLLQRISITISDSDLFIPGISLSAAYGGVAVEQTFALENNGAVDADWSVVGGADWLTISPDSGTLAAGLTTPLLFSADPSGLAPGTHVVTNRFTAPSMAEAFMQTVEMTVGASDLSIADYGFEAQSDSFEDPEKELTLSNGGTIAADWAVSGAPAWLTISPSSGTLAAGDSVILSYKVATSGMAAGTYTASNIFSASSMVGSVTQQVTFVVTDYDFHVAVTGDDSNDGTSWATAKKTIQAGVDAQTQQAGVVWVSNGTYAASAEIVVDKSITLKSHAGAEYTIVDGGGSVRCFNLFENGILDGFTIRNGYADGLDPETGSGGGVLAEDATIQNCVFSGNTARLGGGGLAGVNCSVSNTLFSNNDAEVVWLGDYLVFGGFGGGATLAQSRVYQCNFAGNTAHYGGGLVLSNSTATACVLSGNAASGNGGGAFVMDSRLNGLSFTGNNAATNGGAIFVEGGASFLEAVGCTNNTAGVNGGGIYMYDKSDADGDDSEGGTLSLHGNEAGEYGGGAYLWHGGKIDRSTVSGNRAGIHGGGVAFRLAGAVYRSQISDNVAETNGGGVYFSEGGYLRSTTVSGNQAERGAGLYHNQAGDSRNVLLTGNSASVRGGGIYCYKGGTLNGITCSGNQATEYGSGFYAYNDASNALSSIVLENAIVWEATDPVYRSGADISVRYICSNESYTNGMEHLITADPLLSADRRLLGQSPCINAGTNNNGQASDADGNPRVVNGSIDLGACEYVYSTDNYDGDSFSNGDEAIAGTDPLDKADAFHLVSISGDTVYFQSVGGRQYTLYWSTNLVNGSWIPDATRYGNNDELSITSTNSNAHSVFYRVGVSLDSN